MNNKFIRNSFNGLTKEVLEWECITPTAFLKGKYRKEKAEREIINGYLNAAENLYMDFDNENNPIIGIKFINSNQLCMPFLYMCRHTVELSIKYKLKELNAKYNKTHRLSELWEKLKEEIKIENEDFDLLIETFDIIDDNGCKLRYAVDKYDNEYNNKPIFIKADLIMETTKQIYNYLTQKD